MRRLVVIAAAALVWAAPAQAFTRQTGTRTMGDGAVIAYDLYLPDGSPPTGGWPGVIALHGLGGSKDQMAPVAAVLAAQGYAVLAYSARGEGTSTGDLTLAGPAEISDERAMFDFFAGLAAVSDTQIGVWGISYGGGEAWDGMAAGIPYKAAEVVDAWTDLYSALWPQNVAKSGIVLGLLQALEARSPLLRAAASDAVHSRNLGELRALADTRSSLSDLQSITTPVYMFQGRVDYTFDVTQAANAFLHVGGPKHLYIGQFGHAPATFPGPDVTYVLTQGLAWFDHYLKGAPNGIDASPPVTIAAASGPGRATFAGLPPTRTVTVGLPGTRTTRVGARLTAPLETFGASVLRLRVRRLRADPRLVATVTAGARVITDGAIVPHVGLNTIRLANHVQYLPSGTRLTVHFGASSAAGDPTYLGLPGSGAISLGTASLALHTLTRPIGG
jgi:alpha-beta hydrolase superfamily lysophospholipase